MGKPAPVVLCLAAVVFLTVAPTRAQTGPAGPGVNPGPDPHACAFLTADDLEHLDAALGYVNLTRRQLNYEKKHADHRLRLAAADAALDDPAGLPRTAHQAAQAFALAGSAATRARHASDLLDLPAARWSLEELQKDGEIEARRAAEYEAAGDAADALRRKHDAEDVARLLGGPPRSALPEEHLLFAARGLVAAHESLKRPAVEATEAELRGLAAALPAEITDADARLPGAEGESKDWYTVAARAGTQARLVAGARLALFLEREAAQWSQRVKLRGAQAFAGTPVAGMGVTGGVIGLWQGPWGKFVIGGTGPNTYEGDDFIAIIDLGGDDIYRGRVACGIGLPGRAPISFVLDLGGNDRYEGGDFTQGFGFLGVGILHDLGAGNDYYACRFCGQGCGLCGYGELYDDGGDDIYLADSGAQGAAAFGYGHLIDARGNDTYRGARYVQAFAQVMGVGVLTDGGGNDLYFAGGKYLHQPLWNDRYQSLSQGFAIGNRYGGTGGGVALLLDEGDGNDVYQCDIYGQGSSYWYALGMLVDLGGNDTYTAGQYCQGAGIHLSAGILVDLAGNDTYSMGVGLGQGAAHDWAVGWLIDRAGNDLYQGNGQGMGLNYSVGLLLDCAGDDSHSTGGDGSIGKGHNNDISLLLDLGGRDNYGHREIKDGEITRRDRRALVYDVPEGWFPAIDPSTLPVKQNPAPARVRVQHILIAWDGTGVNTQKAARDKAAATAEMKRVLKLARTRGADWKQLQVAYNEDCAKGVTDKGEAYDNTHNVYDVTPDARLVKPFLDCALKLGVGQIDVAESKYGWHIIKRVE